MKNQGSYCPNCYAAVLELEKYRKEVECEFVLNFSNDVKENESAIKEILESLNLSWRLEFEDRPSFEDTLILVKSENGYKVYKEEEFFESMKRIFRAIQCRQN